LKAVGHWALGAIDVLVDTGEVVVAAPDVSLGRFVAGAELGLTGMRGGGTHLVGTLGADAVGH